jgi:hypothetical protein
MNALMILGALVGFLIGSGPGGHEFAYKAFRNPSANGAVSKTSVCLNRTPRLNHEYLRAS